MRSTLDDIRRSFAGTCANFSMAERFHERDARFGSIGFANKVAGVKVGYEVPCYIYVRVCRLINGEFPGSTGEMTPVTVLHDFDLIDLVDTRETQRAGELIKCAMPVVGSAEFRRSLRIYAAALVDFGAQALNGDFTDFAAADAIVKARARANAIEKWGDEARKFGW